VPTRKSLVLPDAPHFGVCRNLIVVCHARYRGSADAVRNNLENITEVFDGEPVDDLLILSGQALYSMVRRSAIEPCFRLRAVEVCEARECTCGPYTSRLAWCTAIAPW
jgi:hypothetical protein